MGFASSICLRWPGSVVGFDGDDIHRVHRIAGPYGVAVDTSEPATRGGQVQRPSARRDCTLVTTTAVAGGFVGDNCRATLADFVGPENLAFDSAGTTTWLISANRIRKTTAGAITTVAGDGTSGYTGDGLPAVRAQLYAPFGVAADPFGSVYIAITNNAVITKGRCLRNDYHNTIPIRLSLTCFP